MRRPGYYFFFFFLAVGASSLRGAPSEIGFLPEEKVGVAVPATERNPFGKHTLKSAEAPAEEKGTEETQIREIVDKLSCQGLMRGGGKTEILLGSLQVEEGEILPQLIPKQTEKIKVLAILRDRVELGFVEKDGKVAQRKMSVAYDLGPNVRFKLGGATPPAKEAELGGVIKKNEPAPSVQ